MTLSPIEVLVGACTLIVFGVGLTLCILGWAMQRYDDDDDGDDGDEDELPGRVHDLIAPKPPTPVDVRLNRSVASDIQGVPMVQHSGRVCRSSIMRIRRLVPGHGLARHKHKG